MARRSVQWYLYKVLRISGYVFFFVAVLMIMSGLAAAGRFGFHKLFSAQTGWKIHRTLMWPVIGLVLIHGIVAWYLSFRRWKWVK
jgi:cytochrome b561